MLQLVPSCELFLLEACSFGRAQFGNPEEGECPSLEPLPSNDSEDVTVDTNVCVIVNCKV
jgi:hypothetical protein